MSADVREGVARRLLAVSATLEHEFGAAQVGGTRSFAGFECADVLFLVTVVVWAAPGADWMQHRWAAHAIGTVTTMCVCLLEGLVVGPGT